MEASHDDRRRRVALIVTTLLSTIAVPGGLLVGIPYSLLRSGLEIRRFDLGPLWIVGIVAVIVGIAVLVWCTAGFVIFGRGTPNPVDPPRSLVARGIYRRVRNPMYVAIGVILAGEAMLFGSTALIVYAVALMAVFHVFVVSYEEPTLRRLFGSPYDEYCARVPRWIPTVTRVR